MLLPSCFTIGMVPGFLQPWCWHSGQRVQSWFHQRILFLMACESLGAFWQTPGMQACAFSWPLYHIGLIGGVLQRWLSFWKVLPSLQRNFGALSEWPCQSDHAQFGRVACTRKSLGGSKFLPFKHDGGHCLLGDLQCCSFPQICASTQSCLGALQTILSTSWLGFCSDMHCQLWDLI